MWLNVSLYIRILVPALPPTWLVIWHESLYLPVSLPSYEIAMFLYPAMKYLFYPLKYRGKHRFHVLFSDLACQRLMTLFLTAINFFVCGGGKRNTVMHRQNQMYQKNACIFLEKALEDFTW